MGKKNSLSGGFSGAPLAIASDYMIISNLITAAAFTDHFVPPQQTLSGVTNAAQSLPLGNVFLVPFACTVSGLVVALDSNATGTGTTITIGKNGVAGAVTKTLATGVTTGHTTGLQETFAQGDHLTVHSLKDTDASALAFSFVLTPN